MPEEKIYEVWIETQSLYKVPVRATDPEQAAQFCEKHYKHDTPDHKYLYEETPDDVSDAQPSETHIRGEEEHDATNFEFTPK